MPGPQCSGVLPPAPELGTGCWPEWAGNPQPPKLPYTNFKALNSPPAVCEQMHRRPLPHRSLIVHLASSCNSITTHDQKPKQLMNVLLSDSLHKVTLKGCCFQRLTMKQGYVLAQQYYCRLRVIGQLVVHRCFSGMRGQASSPGQA